MREIKFKGKRVDNNDWIVGSLLRTTKDNPDGTEWWWIYTNDFKFQVIPESVGQFTRLLDKNDKEIYEGDIVKYYDADYNKYMIDVVEFEDFTDVSDWLNWTDKEVIGNIYENPELMEKK